MKETIATTIGAVERERERESYILVNKVSLKIGLLNMYIKDR